MTMITHDPLDRLIETFIQSCKQKAPGLFVTAGIYGSLIRGHYKPEISDVNILMIYERLDVADLQALAPLIQHYRDKHRFACVILSRKELHEYERHFPVKFYEMKTHFKIIEGPDLLQPLQMEWLYLKTKIEEEILNIKIKLRKSLLIGDNHLPLLVGPLKSLIPQVLGILRVLIDTPQSQRFDTDDRLYVNLIEKKGKLEFLSYPEVIGLYDTLFREFDRIIEDMEAIA
jgi:hypothetical protein